LTSTTELPGVVEANPETPRMTTQRMGTPREQGSETYPLVGVVQLPLFKMLDQ